MKKLIESIIKFRDDRNWNQFHNVKDLLLGLNIEVAELQEIFLWSENVDSVDKQKIEGEVSDVFIFLVYICDHYKINFKDAIQKKLEVHKSHYPIDKSRNNTNKYNNLNG
ncbi:nucleotide pyrophosphohydrolase [Flavobacterium arcticum]|nr:nucleotide pyrophosphohydrolase [Flavobacterium arcticum]KAF2512469.1 nucleotide pyrophosphohydrolase [Flavobacterium arcticum]